MGWKLVQVPAYEPDPTPPGIWPPPGVVSPPIYYPPGIWPPPGVVSPPIHYPPEIWPTPPTGGGSPGVPTHPIYNPGQPAHPIVEPPLGIWGGGGVPMPTPPIHYPPSGGGAPGVPTHPIAGPPPVISGGLPWPTPPIYYPPVPPPSPIFDPDNMPGHPELPDLNSGYWMQAYDPHERTVFSVFVAGPVSDNPEEPVNRTPGDWVVVRGHDELPAWAWRPEPVSVDNTLPGDQPYPDHGLPGDQPRPDHDLPGDQPYPDQGLPGDQPVVDPRKTKA